MKRQYITSELIADGKLVIGDGYRAKNAELSAIGFPFVRAGNLNNGFHFENVDCFPEENIAKVGEKISRAGDVVFTSKGTVGRFAYVDEDIPQFVYSPQLCYWRSLDWKTIYPRWLYYWINSNEFWSQAASVKGQTDMADYVSLTDQRRMIISLPSIKKQIATANILGALDDKIELNRQMNQTLEKMAQAMFKSWFVDFDPVVAKAAGKKPFDMSGEIAALFPDKFEDSELGLIPKGWEAANLLDSVEIIDCLHSKKPSRIAKQGYILLQLNNIRDNGMFDFSDNFFISEKDYKKWTSRIEPYQGDCVITNVGRVGAVAQIPKDVKVALGRNMTGSRCKTTFNYPSYLICYLLSDFVRGEINRNTDYGTILKALNVKNIGRLKIIRSPKKITKVANDILHSYRLKMESNNKESSIISDVRDTILPKLISGEIRIKNAEKMVSEAA
ncbi:MAG: restriction endonuclease subunit S [Deltaproteobacteria bacterium]|nr:restriction endonuclease subunit S [Deltaproteobacteria bacterium]